MQLAIAGGIQHQGGSVRTWKRCKSMLVCNLTAKKALQPMNRVAFLCSLLKGWASASSHVTLRRLATLEAVLSDDTICG
jgi:hypothetical protein